MLTSNKTEISEKAAWYSASLLTAAYLFSMLDRTILSLLIEPIQRDLKISDTQFSLLQGFAFVTFYSVATIPVGILVDRVQRRKVVGWGVLLWSGMTALSGFAGNYAQLFVARVGVGIGEAALSPSAYSMLADLFTKQKLAKALAVYSIGAMLGSALAYLFGGTVVAILSGPVSVSVPLVGDIRPWQVAFLVAGIPGVLLAARIFNMPEPPRVNRATQPVSWADLFRFTHLRMWFLGLHLTAFSCLTITGYAYLMWGPAVLLRSYGMEPGHVGLVMGIAAGVFGLAGYVLGGVLADRWAAKGQNDAYMRVGMLASTAAIPIAAIGFLSSWPILASIALCLLVCCNTLPQAAGHAGLQLVLPPYMRGRIMAIYMVIINIIGIGIGPLAVALLTDRVFEDRNAVNLSLAVVSLVTLPVLATCFALARKPFVRELRERESGEIQL